MDDSFDELAMCTRIHTGHGKSSRGLQFPDGNFAAGELLEVEAVMRGRTH